MSASVSPVRAAQPRLRVAARIREGSLHQDPEAADSRQASRSRAPASPSDLPIAACAHRYAAGVLHYYDRDYDVVVEFPALDFNSQWLAAPGTL